MKVIIGSDHGGFSLKEILRVHLIDQSYDVVDVGTFSKDACDYPDIVTKFGQEFPEKSDYKGILLCGSGQGVCIMANRMEGMRAVLCRTPDDAHMSRRHNDANVCCLGGRVTSSEEAIKIVDIFLTEHFMGGRHARRVAKIDSYLGSVPWTSTPIGIFTVMSVVALSAFAYELVLKEKLYAFFKSLFM
ncbi:MAG: ribose 5-phosphate isomerase B [Alphaproteobacteria bacterium]|nr:MAG: ribose 5-phosphate isomerase B [Alphaproteobacteria bacterium]